MDKVVKRKRKQSEVKFTPVELLRNLLASIEDGQCFPVGIAVAFFEKTPKGESSVVSLKAGLSMPDHVALLEFVKMEELKKW